MDAYRAIVTKRDTRHFADRPIPPGVQHRILQAGRMAGSSKNTQPIRYVVFEEQERKEAVAACGHYAKHVPGSALAIAVVVEPGGSAFDAGRAAQNMMVAAWADGVTSCPTSMHETECISETIGLPTGYTVAIVLAMGYPEEGKKLGADRQRISIDDLVHRERW